MKSKILPIIIASLAITTANLWSQTNPTPPASVDAEIKKYEVRGIMEIGDQPQVSIYYSGQLLGWMKPGQKKGDCTLKAYDSKTKEAIVEIDGKEYRLKQSQSEVSVVDFKKERLAVVDKRVLDLYDTNKDGVIDAEERRAMFDKMREGGREGFEKMMDLNGDGVVSEEERQAFREYGEQKRTEFEAEMVKKYDKDGDGKLSREERREAMEKEGFGGREGGRRERGDRQERGERNNPTPQQQ